MKTLLNIVSLLSFSVSFSQEIKCTCINYIETDTTKTYVSNYAVSKEEFTQIPPLSETIVNYTTNYDLEKDSTGRVLKMIRSYYNDNITEEITYIYDENDRLIREEIHFENNIKSEKSFLYREEQVLFIYDENGTRTGRLKKVIYGPNNELIIEKCSYSY